MTEEKRMLVIWKYSIDFPHPNGQVMELPIGAEILHVDKQLQDVISFWAKVDPQAPKEVRHFTVVATGQEFDPELKHVGTFLLHDGTFVFHLFEDRFYGLSQEEKAEKKLKEAIKANIGLF